MDGRRSDRKQAGAVTKAHQTVLVLASAEGRDALEEQDRPERRPRKLQVGPNERFQLLPDLVCLRGPALIAEKNRLEVERRELAVAGEPWIGQLSLDNGKTLIARPFPVFGNLRERGIGPPGIDREQGRRESSLVDRRREWTIPDVREEQPPVVGSGRDGLDLDHLGLRRPPRQKPKRDDSHDQQQHGGEHQATIHQRLLPERIQDGQSKYHCKRHQELPGTLCPIHFHEIRRGSLPRSGLRRR